MRPYAVLHCSDRICCNNDRLLPALNAGDSYIIHTYGRSSSTYNVTLFKDIICIYCIERFKLICSTWALTSSVVSELLVSCARCLFALEKKQTYIHLYMPTTVCRTELHRRRQPPVVMYEIGFDKTIFGVAVLTENIFHFTLFFHLISLYSFTTQTNRSHSFVHREMLFLTWHS